MNAHKQKREAQLISSVRQVEVFEYSVGGGGTLGVQNEPSASRALLAASFAFAASCRSNASYQINFGG